jgi:hypothetical protein
MSELPPIEPYFVVTLTSDQEQLPPFVARDVEAIAMEQAFEDARHRYGEDREYAVLEIEQVRRGSGRRRRYVS